MKLFDLKSLFNDTSDQVIWLLAIVATVMMIGAYATQGFARAAFAIIGVFILIMLVLLLKNSVEIGEWLKNIIFVNDGEDSAGAVQTIVPWIRLL
ncbi:hypothetical protein QK095_002526 [Enterococcus faecalis]|nr:hypothetical protein [Enterococcus faecalis]EKZ0433763.1 hypothetical protein [Enterococcus faecalis]